MGEFAKALENAAFFEKRWQKNVMKRFNRHFDDRDLHLAAALKVLEERSSTNYPAPTVLPAGLLAPSIGGGAVTGIALTGVNFIGEATKSSGSSENSAGVLDLEAVLPGEQTIAVTITDTGAALGVTADVVAGTIDVVLGDGGGAGTAGAYTVAEVVAAIDADAEAMYMVEAAVGTAGDMDADESFDVTGGTGDLMTFAIGPYAMDGSAPGNGITEVTDTTITMDLDPSDMDGAATALVATTTYPIVLVVDGVKVEMPPVVAAA